MIKAVEAITRAVAARDPYTARHQCRVARLAETMAREMRLRESECRGIRIAGILHDIGKLQVPMDILSKPAALNGAETDLVRMHVECGYRIIKDIQFPWPVPEMVLQHHERMDGSGYPHGLRGGEIRLGARILSVADTTEAMISHRPYSPALGRRRALPRLVQGRGKLFDADAVDACLRLLTERRFMFDRP